MLLFRQASVKTTTHTAAVNSVVQIYMISYLIVDARATLLVFKSFFFDLLDNTKSGQANSFIRR